MTEALYDLYNTNTEEIEVWHVHRTPEEVKLDNEMLRSRGESTRWIPHDCKCQC